MEVALKLSIIVILNLQIGTPPMKRILIMVKIMWRLLIWWSCRQRKQFVQPLPFVPTTAPMEEHPPPPPPQAQLITITTKEKSNVDSFEEKRKVEDDIKKEIVGGIFME
jgi:hypothetical protein